MLGCLAISPIRQALTNFESIEEFLAILRDSIKAHKSLYLKEQILHPDISKNNIIIIDPKKVNNLIGMIININLIKEIGNKRTGAQHQTKIMKLMSI